MPISHFSIIARQFSTRFELKQPANRLEIILTVGGNTEGNSMCEQNRKMREFNLKIFVFGLFTNNLLDQAIFFAKKSSQIN